MKINVTNAIIAFILSVLITYGIANIEDNSMRMLTAIGGFVFIFITSFFAIGITYKLPRTGVVLRIVSIVFF